MHRRRLQERRHRQTVLGFVSVIGMLALGAVAVLIFLQSGGQGLTGVDAPKQSQAGHELAPGGGGASHP